MSRGIVNCTFDSCPFLIHPIIHLNYFSPIGLITLGNVLSHLTSKRVVASDPVSKCMIHFSTKHTFEEITPLTPLANLKQFFEKNSVALVTKPDSKEIAGVCTQIDLLNFLVLHPESVE